MPEYTPVEKYQPAGQPEPVVVLRDDTEFTKEDLRRAVATAPKVMLPFLLAKAV